MAENAGAILNESRTSARFAGAILRLSFLDNLRYLTVVFVLIYHSVAAYATVAPHWIVRDTSSWTADIIRELFDVFMMPVLFFIAGYFGLASLRKKGAGEFLKDKIRRLLLPWALAVLVFLPLLIYDRPINPVRPFWKFWIWYMGSFEIRLRFVQASDSPTTQAIYWFLSLLFAFFLLFALLSALAHRRDGKILPGGHKTRSAVSPLAALGIFGLSTSIGYFLVLLLFPDSSWFTLHMFLEFQVTRLVPYAASFMLGGFALSRGWFADRKPMAGPILWGTVALLLAAVYLMIGRPAFSDTGGTASLSIPFLLIFALVRSFLLVSVLAVLLSFGIRYWNRASGLDRQLSEASYDIYLVHYWFVVALQAALVTWAEAPMGIKAGIVSAGSLGLSFAVSRWVLARHSRLFALSILGLFIFCLAFRP